MRAAEAAGDYEVVFCGMEIDMSKMWEGVEQSARVAADSVVKYSPKEYNRSTTPNGP